MTALWFLILTLAVYRITRLYIYDTITKSFRGWVTNKLIMGWKGNSPVGTGSRYGKVRAWASDLVACTWCLGLWVAFVVAGITALATNWGPNVWEWIIVSLALAASQSFVHMTEDLFDTFIDD